MLESYKSGCKLLVYVQPGARASEVDGRHGEPPRLKIRLHAPAREGEANQALIIFLADLFELGRRDVLILRGEKSRHKDVWLNLPEAKAQLMLKKKAFPKEGPC